MDSLADCLIGGGGPAGLTTAIYAARFRLRNLAIDDGASRASQIPCTRNQVGIPDGIAGCDLLARLRTQAARYGAELRVGRVTAIEGVAPNFIAHLADHTVGRRP